MPDRLTTCAAALVLLLCGCSSVDPAPPNDPVATPAAAPTPPPAPADEGWLRQVLPPAVTTFGEIAPNWQAAFPGAELTRDDEGLRSFQTPARVVTGLQGPVRAYRLLDDRVSGPPGQVVHVGTLAWLAEPIPFDEARRELGLTVDQWRLCQTAPGIEGVVVEAGDWTALGAEISWVIQEGRLSGVFAMDKGGVNNLLLFIGQSLDEWTTESKATRQLEVLRHMPAEQRWVPLEAAEARWQQVAGVEPMPTWITTTPRVWRKVVGSEDTYAIFRPEDDADRYDRTVTADAPSTWPSETLLDAAALREALASGGGHEAAQAASLLTQVRLGRADGPVGAEALAAVVERAGELFDGCLEAGDMDLAAQVLVWWEQTQGESAQAEILSCLERLLDTFGLGALARHRMLAQKAELYQGARYTLPPRKVASDTPSVILWFWEVAYLLLERQAEHTHVDWRRGVASRFGGMTADLRSFVYMLSCPGGPYYIPREPQRAGLRFSWKRDGEEYLDLSALERERLEVTRMLARRLYMILGLEAYAKALPAILIECNRPLEERVALWLHALEPIDPRMAPGVGHPAAEMVEAALKQSVARTEADRRAQAERIALGWANTQRALAEAEPLLAELEAADAAYPRLTAEGQHAEAGDLAARTAVVARDLEYVFSGDHETYSRRVSLWTVRGLESRWRAYRSPGASASDEALRAALAAVRLRVGEARRVSLGYDDDLVARARAVGADFEGASAEISSALATRQGLAFERERQRAAAAAAGSGGGSGGGGSNAIDQALSRAAAQREINSYESKRRMDAFFYRRRLDRMFGVRRN